MVEAGIRRGSQSPIPELDVLWITAGLGCDGDTIAMTAPPSPALKIFFSGKFPGFQK